MGGWQNQAQYGGTQQQKAIFTAFLINVLHIFYIQCRDRTLVFNKWNLQPK